ncbi:TetR/AcrR family transcriptional regulator [Sinimarinibacterium sp. CAU 1509]|uniref:TetR/AcrR family transcriptional regulator n=1 Tax=Sinimarinibacterium sp. CAU 1509 TaxID=2562283 RepID=UPI00146AE682|nr:TetR/AcrR family transcriptional regulator [Sinimarinibacterium sp. CAU 1509]
MLPTPSAAPHDSRSARSTATRSKLIAIAERLFAQRGIEGVSLNDINKAAGQRNKNATHYHFGNKDGLLQAILEKHQPQISARCNQLLDAMQAQGEATLAQVVHAMTQPLIEKLFDADGGRHFLRFNAHFVLRYTMAAIEPQIGGVAMPAGNFGGNDRLTGLLLDVVPHLPAALLYQRGILAASLLLHGLAEHSRVLDSIDDADQAAQLTALFAANLQDCLIALLSAPASAQTQTLALAAAQVRTTASATKRKPRAPRQPAAG